MSRSDRSLRVVDEYFEALRIQDWARLSTCLADEVHRVGPYRDVVHGKRAYVEFLAGIIPTLKSYDVKISRVRPIDTRSAVAEISEFADVRGVRTECPEVILFELDRAGSIARIDIYLKQPPPPRS